MNNQEAADELQYAIDLIKQDGKDWLDERDIPVLEMAISALQAQEAKTQLSAEGTTSDLISRQVAVDALRESRLARNPVYMTTAMQVIEKLPSAQPEPLVKESRTLVKDSVKDTISRQEAIEALNRCTDVYHTNLPPLVDKEEVRRALASLPSAQPEPQWIPVSERLPEEDKDVLVTVYVAGLTQKHKTGWNDHIKPSTYVDIASYYGGDWVSASDEYKVARSRHRVIAWMPLPKEYSGE